MGIASDGASISPFSTGSEVEPGLLQSSPKSFDFAIALELILTAIDIAGISAYHTKVEYSQC
jgi:hypothetical protein